MNNDLNLLYYNTSNDEDYNRPLSIRRLNFSSTFSTYSIGIKLLDYKNGKCNNYEIKKGCTCISSKVSGKTLGELVNPILDRTFFKRKGGQEL